MEYRGEITRGFTLAHVNGLEPILQAIFGVPPAESLSTTRRADPQHLPTHLPLAPPISAIHKGQDQCDGFE